MDLAKFCDSLNAMGPPCRPFHLENAELCCIPPLCGSQPPPNLNPYVSACGIDKELSKMAGNSASYAL